MTPQELQIKVAELCGWTTELDDEQFWRACKPDGTFTVSFWLSKNAALQDYPPYSTSLDAIQAAAFEKFTASRRHEALFTANLYDKGIKLKFNKYLWQLTAADWCEAFLATCKEIEK